MKNLRNKKIVLAVTGSIAAYKTPALVRLLVKAGADVQVLMTRSAQDFVTPLTLSTVSGKAVYADLSNEAQWHNHVHLGLWADAMLIAPCSANTLAKLAHGLCDNIVQAVYLSARCPVMIAPAMDEDMWLHPSAKHNINTLLSYGNTIIPVDHGELASGLTGAGRMAEPEAIVEILSDFFNTSPKDAGSKKALVTAGPTYEHIDPVRFIGNFSSGKMGIAMAEALAGYGYQVDLVLGPAAQVPVAANIRVHQVTSAQEMYDICMELFPKTNIAVMAAAVSDFRPEERAEEKIKKGAEASMQIQLVRNPDILAALGKIKKAGQTLIGFALETQNERKNAEEKLRGKNADYIALNSLKDAGAGFGTDTNKITLIGKNGWHKEFPLQPKKQLALKIMETILDNTNVKSKIKMQNAKQ